VRPTTNLLVERHRVKEGVQATSRYDGNNGCFIIPVGKRKLFCIVSDGERVEPAHLRGWEHVSVSVLGAPSEPPTWAEMHAVKELFWRDDECVVEYHPPKADYVNVHEGVLHLWRPLDAELPRPPKVLV
jgi:hypothetical protein